MTNGSLVIRRLALGSVAVGALAIIVGNSQIAMGVSVQTHFIGYAVRYVGLGICILTAILFLVVRIDARRSQRAQHQNPTPQPAERMSASGPSQTLLSSIRVYCMFLFFLGIFTLVSSVSAFIGSALGQYRLGGPQSGYVIVYMLFQPAALLVSGFLIWFMTDTIVRMSEQLDEVSYKLAKLQQRINQMPGTNPQASGR